MDLETFQAQLGYRFSDADLLLRALTHPSYANERALPDNQRLEFLGDAVLDLTASVLLLDSYPRASEGELSKLRATMVNEAALAEIGRRLAVPDVLRLGRSELCSGGAAKPSVLADTVEAIFGAIYVESGYDEASHVLRRWLILPTDADAKGDPKSRLQEWAQKQAGQLPVYEVEAELGPHHDREYHVSVTVLGSVRGRGIGRTKKEAERQAALAALVELGNA